VFARTCALDGITFSGINEIEGYRQWLHQKVNPDAREETS
jgi:hypothetical protein